MEKLVSNNVIERFKRGKRIGSINNTAKGLKIQEIQKRLNNSGAALKVDGWLGPKTEAAILQQWGRTALNVLKTEFNTNSNNQQLPQVQDQQKVVINKNNWVPEVAPGGQCHTKECAEWANDSLRKFKDSEGRNIYSYDEIGGDAWTRLSAGKHAKMVYSGYSGTTYDPKIYSESASNKRNWNAADKLYKEFDSKTLDKNKVYLVNMYFNSSPNKRKAWEGATNGTTGTHTGNLYWNPKTNSWRVAHNIHGTMHDDDFIKTQGSRNGFGYGVTAIAEAPSTSVANVREDWNNAHPIKAAINKIYDFGVWKQGGKIQKKQYGGNMLPEVTISAINPNKVKIGPAREFVNSLNSNRNLFMKRYNLSDQEYNDLSKFAVNIAQKESGLGTGLSYMLRQGIPDPIIQLGKQLIRGKSSAQSRGLSQIKYNDDIGNPFLKHEYDALGITEDNLEHDYDSMAKATIARAKYVQDFLNSKKGVDKYHYSNGELIPRDTAMAMYWNRGKLTDYLNDSPKKLEADGATGYARRFEHQKILK